MELREDQLTQIEEMAAALMPPGDIAILLDIPYAERNAFCERCKSHEADPVYNRYQKGKLQTKFELRKTVVKLAKAGSPAAEPLAEKFMKEQSKSE